MAVGRALRRLRGKVTQAELAQAVGVTQGTVSRWENDAEDPIPDFEEMARIEKHLKLRRGAILVAAGLVEVEGVESAVLADARLDAQARDLLLGLYQFHVNRDPQPRHRGK